MKKMNGKKIDALKIDKDCFVKKSWIKDLVKMIGCECKKRGIKVKTVKMCDSRKKGFHLYIKIEPAINPEKANFLQWIFGDDSRRVDFNRARIDSGLIEWNKLFEEPYRNLKIIYQSKGNIKEVTNSD